MTQENASINSSLSDIEPAVQFPIDDNDKFERQIETEFENISIMTSFFEMQAKRDYMEDRTIISKDRKLCAVFDGHGGSKVADFLFQSFEKLFNLKLEYSFGRHEYYTNEEIISGFTQTLAEIDNTVLTDKMESGSTATIAYINLHATDCQSHSIVTANVGDSRIVLSRNKRAIELTVDHKPTLPAEKARIEALGGRVFYNNGYRVMGCLAMSRAIGDAYLRPYVCADPDCVVHDLDEYHHRSELVSGEVVVEKGEFIIVASDGLWDMVSSQRSVDFIHEELAKIDHLLSHTNIVTTILQFASTLSEDECTPTTTVRDIYNLFREDIPRKLGMYSYRIDPYDNISIVIQWIDRDDLQYM